MFKTFLNRLLIVFGFFFILFGFFPYANASKTTKKKEYAGAWQSLHSFVRNKDVRSAGLSFATSAIGAVVSERYGMGNAASLLVSVGAGTALGYLTAPIRYTGINEEESYYRCKNTLFSLGWAIAGYSSSCVAQRTVSNAFQFGVASAIKKQCMNHPAALFVLSGSVALGVLGRQRQRGRGGKFQINSNHTFSKSTTDQDEVDKRSPLCLSPVVNSDCMAKKLFWKNFSAELDQDLHPKVSMSTWFDLFKKDVSALFAGDDLTSDDCQKIKDLMSKLRKCSQSFEEKYSQERKYLMAWLQNRVEFLKEASSSQDIKITNCDLNWYKASWMGDASDLDAIWFAEWFKKEIEDALDDSCDSYESYKKNIQLLDEFEKVAKDSKSNDENVPNRLNLYWVMRKNKELEPNDYQCVCPLSKSAYGSSLISLLSSDAQKNSLTVNKLELFFKKVKEGVPPGSDCLRKFVKNRTYAQTSKKI